MVSLPRLKILLTQIPGVCELRYWNANRGTWRLLPGPGQDWQRRYRDGENSGSGSVTALADFNASVLSSYVEQHGVTSVIESGYGDGNQLRQAQYPVYIDLDGAREAIQLCRDQLVDDTTTSFLFCGTESKFPHPLGSPADFYVYERIAAE